MDIPSPYFITNKKWYITHPVNNKVKRYCELTELGKSIPKVKKSYDDYYKLLEDKSNRYIIKQ